MKGHRNTILTNQSIVVFLLLNAFRVLIPSHSLSLPSTSWDQTRYIDYDVSDRLLTALQGRSPLTGELLAPESEIKSEIKSESDKDKDKPNPKLLNLETDFYDERTGLCSEGVWHNALVGIASLENKNNHASDWERIADSLFQYSWDGKSFRRRSWSGNWDHSALVKDSGVADSDNNLPHQANYYRESSEHRCVQHGIALVFWSKILLDTSQEDIEIDDNMGYGEEQELIADCFVGEFYDPEVKRWTTVSKSQGGGGVRRPSASAASKTLGLPEDAEDTPYYRAVDQAIAVLACLEQVEVLDAKKTQTDDVANQRATMVDLLRTTCADILSPEGFGYGGDDIQSAKSYLGLDRNRNFWHDGWTFLALLRARDYAWPAASESASETDATTHGNGEAQSKLNSMWKGLEEMYGCSDSDGTGTIGTIWHWPKELKGGEGEGGDGDDISTTTNTSNNNNNNNNHNNVRYCGDNALAHAIRRNLDTTESREDGFWNFIAGLTIGHEAGLSSVADVYPQVRLHPNTELSALLVWP